MNEDELKWALNVAKNTLEQIAWMPEGMLPHAPGWALTALKQMDESRDTTANEFCERLIRECIPGGQFCDPQVIADDIRKFFAHY